MMRTCVILIGLLLMLLAAPAFAWGDLGHQVVAQIAWKQLDRSEQQALKRWLRSSSFYGIRDGDYLQASVWPDMIHTRLPIFDRWHYINLPVVRKSFEDAPKPDAENIVNALCNAVYVLQGTPKDPLPSDFATGLMLPMLLHLVGDVHQPLHASARFSEAMPQGDKGGILFPILIKGEPTNLHLFWDLGLGLLGDVHQPKTKKRAPFKQVKELAKAWMKEFPKTHFGEVIQSLRFQDWANQSRDIAATGAYATAEKQEPAPEYVTQGQAIVKERIALAGYRLSHLLSRLLNQRDKTKLKLWEQSCL